MAPIQAKALGRQRRTGVTLALIGLFCFMPEGIAFAADVLLTDIKGNRVELYGVQIAYEKRRTGMYINQRSGLIVPESVSVWQPAGLKLHQGDGQVLVDWARVQKLVIRRLSESDSRILAEIVLRGDPSPRQYLLNW